MWACEIVAAGLAGAGAACALVLPPAGPAAGARGWIEARLAGTRLTGVTDCVLCCACWGGLAAGLWIALAGGVSWWAAVLTPGISAVAGAAIARMRAG